MIQDLRDLRHIDHGRLTMLLVRAGRFDGSRRIGGQGAAENASVEERANGPGILLIRVVIEMLREEGRIALHIVLTGFRHDVRRENVP